MGADELKLMETLTNVAFVFFAFFALLFFTYILHLIENSCYLSREKLLEEIKEGKNNAIKCNPISVSFYLVFYSLFGLWIAIKKTPLLPSALAKATLALGRFLKLVVIYTHSDERVLCLIDSAIGATVGYFAGSAILGGAVGCLFGILNYQLISVRWLKLDQQGA